MTSLAPPLFSLRWFSVVLELIRFDRPAGTLLLFLPGFWSLLASWKGAPPPGLLLIFFLGSFFMRSAGCVINDILDRHVDGLVERTKNRPIVSGRISVGAALAVFIFFCLLSASLLMFLNPLTVKVALVGLLATIVYPLFKRFFPVPQLFMGIPFGLLAPIMAWTASRNELSWAAVFIGLAGLFWSTSYDLVYAISDRDDDIRAGVRSGALTFGDHLWVMILFFGTLSGVFLLMASVRLGIFKALPFAIFLFVLLIFYQSYKVREGLTPVHAQKLFKAHVYLGVIVAMGFLLESPVLL
ncbi:MAG: 4-hydroxybenzoate octaprenyltransferase [Nitrospiraceae bacterium]|jgi:4-hydroxybenzoate polyprenyltransferase|nr:4-hydroxybenzoate octaprenyltransferase [Nitrospiraceae bacterium]